MSFHPNSCFRELELELDVLDVLDMVSRIRGREGTHDALLGHGLCSIYSRPLFIRRAEAARFVIQDIRLSARPSYPLFHTLEYGSWRFITLCWVLPCHAMSGCCADPRLEALSWSSPSTSKLRSAGLVRLGASSRLGWTGLIPWLGSVRALSLLSLRGSNKDAVPCRQTARQPESRRFVTKRLLLPVLVSTELFILWFPLSPLHSIAVHTVRPNEGTVVPPIQSFIHYNRYFRWIVSSGHQCHSLFVIAPS